MGIQLPRNLVGYDMARHQRQENLLAIRIKAKEQDRKDARLVSVRLLQAVLITIVAAHILAL